MQEVYIISWELQHGSVAVNVRTTDLHNITVYFSVDAFNKWLTKWLQSGKPDTVEYDEVSGTLGHDNPDE